MHTIYTEECVPYFLYSIPHCAFVSSPIQIPDQILPVCDFHYKILYIYNNYRSLGKVSGWKYS